MTNTTVSASDAYFAGQEARLLRDLERPRLERLRNLGSKALTGIVAVASLAVPAYGAVRVLDEVTQVPGLPESVTNNKVAELPAEPSDIEETIEDSNDTTLGDGFGEIEVNRPEVLGTIDLGTHESGFQMLREVFVTRAEQEPGQEAFNTLANMMTSAETGYPEVMINNISTGEPSAYRYVGPEVLTLGQQFVEAHPSHSGFRFSAGRDTDGQPLTARRTVTGNGSVITMVGELDLTGSPIPGLAMRRADQTLETFGSVEITLHTQPDGSEVPVSVVLDSVDAAARKGGAVG